MEMGTNRLRHPRPLRLIHTDKGRVKEVADGRDRLENFARHTLMKNASGRVNKYGYLE